MEKARAKRPQSALAGRSTTPMASGNNRPSSAMYRTTSPLDTETISPGKRFQTHRILGMRCRFQISKLNLSGLDSQLQMGGLGALQHSVQRTLASRTLGEEA